MRYVKKAVIPVAGMGTRFLPVTKSVPKELLPILTKPTLQIVVEEAIRSGVDEIILVTSKDKDEIVRFFDRGTRYDEKLRDAGKTEKLSELYDILNSMKVKTVFQDKPKGLGHAVLCAKDVVGDEPFIVILPDVIIESEVPCCRQLIDAFNVTGCAVNATEHSPRDMLYMYGVYDIDHSDGKFHYAREVIEKPETGTEPSDFSVVGRYLFPSDVFKILESLPPGKGGEIQLADAMNELAKNGRMVAYEYDGMQFDTGDPKGFLQANIFYGCKKYGKAVMDVAGLIED